MALNTKENREELIRHFPRLADDENFLVSSENTPVYNCIAWAMGMDDVWVDTCPYPGHWWPSNALCNQEYRALKEAFVSVGFEETDDGSFDPLWDKVVLYGDGSHWTHATRIVSDGVEHGKFGGAWDAFHSGNMFGDSIYGEPFAVMRRKAGMNTKRPKSNAPVINLDNLLI